MRALTICLLVFGLIGYPATAKDNKRKEKKTAATAKDSGKPTTAAAGSAVEVELQQLRDLLQQQQKRIEALEAEVNAAKRTPTVTTSSAMESVLATTPPSTPVSSIPNANLVSGAGQKEAGIQEKRPLSFRIGSADFTPGGFLDFASFTRTTNVGSGIATSFGTIPFNNTPQGALTESRLSAQYSRLSLKVHAGITDSTNITGYVESDFLGFQPANAYVTANSDSLRLRVYWADVRHGKWEVLGGQEWSMLQPNRVGISPDSADVFYTQNEDPNFQVGLVWARQAQLRVVYHPTSWWALGVSLENPDQYAPASVVFPSAVIAGQFDNGSAATNAASAATNAATPTLHPDVIVKTAFDRNLHKHPVHLEVSGLLSSFRIFDNATMPARTDSITGGGGSVNLNIGLLQNLRLIANSFYSCGGGRYIFGLGPDVIVRPDGHLSCVHSGSGIGGIEWQTTPRFMVDAYYGGAYFKRNFGLLPSTATPSPTCDGLVGFTCVGFGFPGSSNSSNRAIQEATIGFIPTLWSSPNYGKLQIITQYSYLTRAPWSVPIGAPKNAHTNLIYVDLRYILP